MIPLEIDRAAFTEVYERGEAQLVWSRIPDDVLTPVGALLRLGRDRPNACLLESVEGGNFRGRYSAIGLDPDLLWRVEGDEAQLCRGDDLATRRFRPDARPPLESLKALVADSAVPLPDGAPAIAAGLFGYLGYEMISFVEAIPRDGPDPVGAPTALLMRPRLVVVFDTIKNDVLLFTPVRPSPDMDAGAAFEDARARLIGVAEELLAPGPRRDLGTLDVDLAPEPNVAPEAFRATVERVKDYVRAGDVFQTVPSQRFSTPFELPPFALYRALRRLNPSPFLFYFSFDDVAVVGSSPEILVRTQAGRVTLRPLAGTRPRGATADADLALERELLADPKELAEHLMLLDLGRNDVGRVCERGTVRVTEQMVIERYSHVMHIVSNVVGELAEGQDAFD
ncbi:MAG: chorismate-binding protein, partial [Caulobacterales bacterium]|nr:chorismate-binding protein [Caulobacterales bacterium]